MFTAGFEVHSANRYVSGSVAASGNGNSWATAWKTPGNINWASVSPGDTIHLDGGAAGMSYGAFATITASGTGTNSITIARSTEPGRDGIVTIATPLVITGSHLKFDGRGYKPIGANTYRCGIVFTCNTRTWASGIPAGASVVVTGQRPWFRYCYFNGTFEATSGHSLGAYNSTGFILDRCWFYQSSWEDQWVYAASSAGGSVAITNTVFQDNNKPDRTDGEHRDVANPFSGAGGWNLYVINSIFFNTPGRAADQPQGDELLLQVGYSEPATPLNEVIAINNVCYNALRFIAFGSSNSGVNLFLAHNNTIRNVIGGDGVGISVLAPALAPAETNNLSKSAANPGFVNATNALGADGIPFTADDGFNLTAGSPAINAGAGIGISKDIRAQPRTGPPDLGAYEFGVSSLVLNIRLTPSNTVALSWPDLPAGYHLQQNSNAAGGAWSAVGTTPVSDGTTMTLIQTPAGNRFYRLALP